ncbi:MAG: murein biosynthesis integral membrane protein MurJ, partial [Gammaproteobacteria bacterium]|nr:murein biosynthesis integral membrane protein MurJ [Gammaproteobacteria bacterium]
GLLKRGIYTPLKGWMALTMRVAAACAVMTAILIIAGADQEVWFDWTALERASRLAVLIFGGGAIYAVTLLLTGLRPGHLLRRGAGAD